MTSDIEVFDRQAVRRHRDRAAAELGRYDFLLREVADRVADRLADMTRRFPQALDLGCHTGQLGAALAGRGVEWLVQTDLSPAMLSRTSGLRVAADEEFLPFADESFDAVLSVLSLHWVNDLPGALIQINRVLRPDGLFVAAMFGGDTLADLRQALLEAETAVESGASPRISPFADVPDAGMLLQRAGFALPVVDQDLITLTYADPFALMRELRGLGEGNAVKTRRAGFTRRETMLTAAQRYRERVGDAAGRVPASFRILYLTGWAPHDSQQKPLQPGSARARLADALGTREHPAGDRAWPKQPGRRTERRRNRT